MGRSNWICFSLSRRSTPVWVWRSCPMSSLRRITCSVWERKWCRRPWVPSLASMRQWAMQRSWGQTSTALYGNVICNLLEWLHACFKNYFYFYLQLPCLQDMVCCFEWSLLNLFPLSWYILTPVSHSTRQQCVCTQRIFFRRTCLQMGAFIPHV